MHRLPALLCALLCACDGTESEVSVPTTTSTSVAPPTTSIPAETTSKDDIVEKNQAILRRVEGELREAKRVRENDRITEISVSATGGSSGGCTRALTLYSDGRAFNSECGPPRRLYRAAIARERFERLAKDFTDLRFFSFEDDIPLR